MSARYEVARTACTTPLAAARASWWAMNGTPAARSRGLGVEMVSGRSRVPCPPTRTIASTGSMGRDATRPLECLVSRPLVGREVRLGRGLPGELLRPSVAGVAERLAPRRIIEQGVQRRPDAAGVAGGVGHGVATDLRQRRAVRGQHGSAARHGLGPALDQGGHVLARLEGAEERDIGFAVQAEPVPDPLEC